MRKKKLSFSGGRTSALMLREEIEENPSFRDQFVVCFCNTGKEFDETLDFVRDCEREFGVEVIWLEYTRVSATTEIANIYPHKKSRDTVLAQVANGETTHWFKRVTYETARRNADPITPFDELLGWANVLPNQNSRMCSVQMKLRTMMRFLFSQGIYEWQDFIGIRADEVHRVTEIERNAPSYARPMFPLVEKGITQKDVLSFWKSRPFDLRLPSYKGNCDLCYLKKWWKRVKVARENPEKAAWWAKWEKDFASKADGDGRFFRIGQPYSAVIRDAAHAEFDFINRLEEVDDDIPCGCTSGAFAEQVIEEAAA